MFDSRFIQCSHSTTYASSFLFSTTNVKLPEGPALFKLNSKLLIGSCASLTKHYNVIMLVLVMIECCDASLSDPCSKKCSKTIKNPNLW